MVASEILLIVAPTVLVAQDYIIVRRIIDFLGKKYGHAYHNVIPKVFLGALMIVVALQGFVVGPTGSSPPIRLDVDLYSQRLIQEESLITSK